MQLRMLKPAGQIKALAGYECNVCTWQTRQNA